MLRLGALAAWHETWGTSGGPRSQGAPTSPVPAAPILTPREDYPWSQGRWPGASRAEAGWSDALFLSLVT
jgi:hypothetical protein